MVVLTENKLKEKEVKERIIEKNFDEESDGKKGKERRTKSDSVTLQTSYALSTAPSKSKARETIRYISEFV